MVIDTTYFNKDHKQLIENFVGKPYRFWESVKIGGIGSKRMIVKQLSPNLNFIANVISDLNYANIELRKKGILIRINKGLSRYYYREALKAYLPSIVKNRITKANISPLVVNHLKKNKDLILKNIEDSSIEDYINIDFFKQKVLKPFGDGVKVEDNSQLIFQVYSLSQWLKKIE
mgnify:CR=1 FL=1